MKEKFNTEEFVINNLSTRILGIKKRLDRLILLLIIITSIGLLYPSDPPKGLTFVISSIKPFEYHLVLSLSLLGLFAIIGSHLVEYVTKRKKIDDLLIDDPYINEKYEDAFSIIKDTSTDDDREKNKLFYISSTIIPNSFYEFFYTLFLTPMFLRFVAVLVLLSIFMFSHAISCIHIVKISPENYKIVSAMATFIIYAVLYGGFLMSVDKSRKKLSESALIYASACGLITVMILLIIKS